MTAVAHLRARRRESTMSEGRRIARKESLCSPLKEAASEPLGSSVQCVSLPSQRVPLCLGTASQMAATFELENSPWILAILPMLYGDAVHIIRARVVGDAVDLPSFRPRNVPGGP